MTLTYPAAGYGAVGISATGMVGTIIVCFHNVTADPWCNTYTGENYDVTTASSSFVATLVSSTSNSTVSVTRFNISVAAFGVTAGAAQRAIFATGPVVSGVPTKHAAGDNVQLNVTFGEAVAPVSAAPPSSSAPRSSAPLQSAAAKIVVSPGTTFNSLTTALSAKTGIPVRAMQLISETSDSATNETTFVILFANSSSMNDALGAAVDMPGVISAAAVSATIAPTEPSASSTSHVAIIAGCCATVVAVGAAVAAWLWCHRSASPNGLFGGAARPQHLRDSMMTELC